MWSDIRALGTHFSDTAGSHIKNINPHRVTECNCTVSNHMQHETHYFWFKKSLTTTINTYNSTEGRREQTTIDRDETATDECLGIREKVMIIISYILQY